jgi:signal transduction histidine kinase/CheY-like chemotaxis protein
VIDPIRDERGELVGFAKITRDITERRDAQAALQEAQTQRAHAQKMDALGQLTGGVAHDFNNLLMVVSAHVETLKPRVAEDARALRAAQAIERAVQRGEVLTRQLLTFSRRQTFNPTVFHLAERVEAFRTMLASSMGGAVTLIASIRPDTWPVKVDANEFELALVNLALNARDAMSNRGVIAITAENVVLSPGDSAARIEGEFVALRVNDTGSGIAPDVLPRVFDPFFTTKEVNKGSGLGLSQVYGFAHQSGGTVTIESELSKGTTVTLYLPATRETASPAPTPKPAVESAGGGTVLVVEDNPEVADVTVAMLEELGYGVAAARDAAAALEAIGRQAFDLVVSDVIMAGPMDGVALARAIRERKPGLPVLLVTGYSPAASGRNAEFATLRKPFQIADLSRTVARMIAEARQPPDSNLVRLRDVKPASPPKPRGG